MKLTHKNSFLMVIALLVVWNLCGCSALFADYKGPIQGYLEAKYNCSFTIHQATDGWSGNDGTFIHAIAESEEFEGETFEVYCYPDDGETQGDQITISGKKYVVYEKYAEVCFAHQMESEIKQLLSDDVFVACRIKFDCGYALHYCVTEDQFDSGLKACLDNKDFYSTVSVYVIADENINMDTVRATVENYCNQYNAFEQYLYFSIAPSLNQSTVYQHFEEHRTSFGKHQLECELIKQVECTEIRRDTGIVERTVEKE